MIDEADRDGDGEVNEEDFFRSAWRRWWGGQSWNATCCFEWRRRLTHSVPTSLQDHEEDLPVLRQRPAEAVH